MTGMPPPPAQITTQSRSSIHRIGSMPNDPPRSRRGYDAPAALAVGLERPPLRAGERVRVLTSYRWGRSASSDRRRPDRPRRPRPGSARDACPGARMALVAELQLEHVADLALGLRAQHVERVGVDVRVCVPLATRAGRPGGRCRGRRPARARARRARAPGSAARALARWFSARERLTAPEQRVAPEGDDARRTVSSREGGDQDGLDRVQSVLGLVEDDAGRRLEDLVGDLEAVRHAGRLGDLAADGGRRCRGMPAGSA